MHRSTPRPRRRPALAALAVLLVSAPAMAQTETAFTYQGSLTLEGQPYTGTADYRFGLYAAPSGGDPITPTQTVMGVAVERGLFGTPIDFGAEAHGPRRYLQIEVRTPAWDGAGAEPPYFAFPDRTPLAAAPYALQTRGIFVNEAASRVGIGTDEPAYTFHTASNERNAMLVESSSPSGTWLTLGNTSSGGRFWTLNSGGSSLLPGTLRIGQGSQLGSSFSILSITPTGRVGINTINPQEALDVVGNVRLSGNGSSIRFSDSSLQTTAYRPIIVNADLAGTLLPSNTTIERLVSVPGAMPGMTVIVNPPFRLWPWHTIGYAYVESPGSVIYSLVSTSGPDRVYGAGVWRITVLP